MFCCIFVTTCIKWLIIFFFCFNWYHIPTEFPIISIFLSVLPPKAHQSVLGVIIKGYFNFTASLAHPRHVDLHSIEHKELTSHLYSDLWAGFLRLPAYCGLLKNSDWWFLHHFTNNHIQLLSSVMAH